MATGTIQRVFTDTNKLFGFLKSHSDGESLFFHRDDLRGELTFDETLIERVVTFEIEDHPKGPRARLVRPT